MKLALLSLAAVVGAVAPRDVPPKNSNPVQTGGETTPTASLTIMPIVSFTPFPTDTTGSSSDKITIPIITSDSTHTTHTFPPTSESSPAPTSASSGHEGSSSSSSHHSSSSGIITHNSTTSSATGTGSGTSGSPSSSRTSSSPSSSPSNAGAAVATANIMAGIAAIAGLVIAA